jgi:lipoyl-dependent peroxiredoxin
MAIRNATAKWNGTLKEGNGTMNFSNYQGPFTFASRFENGDGTNPEELAGAAHAGCYSMFLSALLTNAEHNPVSIETTATVNLGKDDKGPVITHIDLVCVANVPGLDAEAFSDFAAKAKEGCPISRLFAGTEIKLTASLSA